MAKLHTQSRRLWWLCVCLSSLVASASLVSAGSDAPVLPVSNAALQLGVKSSDLNPFVSGQILAQQTFLGYAEPLKDRSLSSDFETKLAPDAEPSRQAFSLKTNQKFAEFLVDHGFENKDQAEIISAVRRVFQMRNLRPSHPITIWRDGAGHPSAIAIEVADDHYVGIYRNLALLKKSQEDQNIASAGTWQANLFDYSHNVRLRAVRGTIKTSLYRALINLDVPPSVMAEMIRRYAFIVDFQRDIHSNSAFRLLYEVKSYISPSGKRVFRPGHLVYSTLEIRGQKLEIFRYVRKNGHVRYLNFNAQTVRRGLMRTPVDATRISSGYGYRIHPIHGYRKAHRGVDFAAPSGARIYAAGDGTITKRANSKSYGKYIEIRHGNGISTLYAHMSRFASSLRIGTRVSQGQIIGYVGSTGLSTGPHLHYEVRINGEQINPAKLRLPSGETMEGHEFVRFRTFAKHVKDGHDLLAASSLQSPSQPFDMPHETYIAALAPAFEALPRQFELAAFDGVQAPNDLGHSSDGDNLGSQAQVRQASSQNWGVSLMTANAAELPEVSRNYEQGAAIDDVLKPISAQLF